MDPAIVAPPYDKLLRVAEEVARERPEVDLELAREVFLEAATLLHNGLALDGLDEHDTDAVVSARCVDLVAPDQGDAIRSRSRQVLEEPGDLHDPESVSRALLIVAALFRL
ncbi:hypothetical protein GCM10009795_010910 [Nocardioides hankookensis]|uniref:DUF222 domain-containing protein n=1 Tax=Nocardioides hankookensis TaxID=443157 RepID=A0ABW1LH12_9ACTN